MIRALSELVECCMNLVRVVYRKFCRGMERVGEVFS